MGQQSSLDEKLAATFSGESDLALPRLLRLLLLLLLPMYFSASSRNNTQESKGASRATAAVGLVSFVWGVWELGFKCERLSLVSNQDVFGLSSN